MRSTLPRTIRNLTRTAQNAAPPCSRLAGAKQQRWYSTPTAEEGGHKWSTPLAKQLAEAIKITGPIPVAAYMRQTLTSDLGGYYSNTTPSDQDQFGRKGDFVTSPEISQIFGELVGIWIVAEWIAQGRQAHGIYLLEVGPGRGTLMDDVLRTLRNFPALAKAVEKVYLVESSPQLREAQHRLLCGEENEMRKTGEGWEGRSKYGEGLKVVWAEDIRLVPKEEGKTPFILAHEFFDALPIHVFQSVPPAPAAQPQNHNNNDNTTIPTPTGPIPTPPRQRQAAKENQWRELLVSPVPPHRLKEGEPEFELARAKAASPHSMYLPETSPRYQALRATEGATIEISPESVAYARDFAIRLGGENAAAGAPKPPNTAAPAMRAAPREKAFIKSQPSGAALIIDYGPPSYIPANSLRGIRRHELVSPFHTPGATDVSADVDFLALAEAAIVASPGVEVHGPVGQGVWLEAMGIEERAAHLVKRAVDLERGGSTGKDKSELTEIVKRIEGGWKRLVDRGPQGMGRLYQVMAMLPYKPPREGETQRRPVGFGGDVQM